MNRLKVANDNCEPLLELIKVVVSHGADIQTVMGQFGTDTVFCRGAHFVKYLMEESAFDGISPVELHKWFMTAYDWQNAEIISMLLPRILDCIHAGEFSELVTLYDHSDVNMSVFNLRQGRNQALETLLRHEEFQGHRAQFFLHSVCQAAFADDKSLRLLLNLGVPVDSWCSEARNFENGLHTASSMNHTTLVLALLEAGANANGEDEDGEIPFDHAAFNFSTGMELNPSPVMELLLTYGSRTGKMKLAGNKPEAGAPNFLLFSQ